MLKLDISFKDLIKQYVINNGIYKPTKQTKHTLDKIMNIIEYILITGSSWRSLNLPIFKDNDIKWQSFYYHFRKFSDNRVFENVYKSLLTKYFRTNMSGKLKYLSIDSSFIKNEYASNVAFNGYYKKKRLSKLSLVVDSNGIPISAILTKGNVHDSKLLDKNIQNLLIEIKPKIKNDKQNNKHKRYFLADAAYDTANVRDTIKSLDITPVIRHVRRKRLDITKNKRFTDKETLIYNRCIIIEHCFSWIYKNRRANRRYDKADKTYMSYLYMTFIIILLRRM